MKTKFFLSLIALSLGINAMAADGDTYVMGALTYTVTSEANREVSVKATSAETISGDIEIPLYIQTDSNGRYLVTSIAADAFVYQDRAKHGSKNLTSITLPESIISIGDYAFYYCSSLTSINIPESVTSIGEYTFFRCKALTSINISNGVTSIGNYAFQDCTSLPAVNISGGVTSIGLSAFSYCSSLTSINLPESVTSIGLSAFSYCSSLTSINIPESVTSIGESTFQQCSSLTSINIPDGVTSIGAYAFVDCSALASINIPDGVTSIGYYAFGYCPKLASINLPTSITSIGRGAFYGDPLITIYIPQNVEKIGNYAFCNHKLEEINVAKDNEYFCSVSGSLYNKDCTSLIEVPNRKVEISLPESLTTIGECAFLHCKFLTSINIPESVTSIGEYAFSGCSALTSINIPESVTSIDYTAFSGCSNLETIYDFNPEPQSLEDSYVFSGISSTATVYVPKQSVNRYLVTPGWDYFTDFRALDNVVIIPAATSLTLDQGETFQMWAKTHFAYDAETITYEMWESLNPAVATISTDGLITAAAEGDTEVKYTVTTVNGSYSTSCKVTVTGQGSSGIENITVEEEDSDATAEYFTLQGVRVNADNLTPGIYIVRQGNTAKKVLVK
ncbi:MAG: leucine-rich repeat protein [Duncaniella sp.]|nr:leucine-rich repeat protein [Duncaniella sp.]